MSVYVIRTNKMHTFY